MKDLAEQTNIERANTEATLISWPFLLVLATALAVTVPFLFFGIPSGHDFEFHMNSWMEVIHQWKGGVAYPHWASLAHFGYGEARFLFYPPASWLIGAMLGVLLPWTLVPAAYIALVLTLCGVSMFLLASRWMPRRDARFAACFYAANPYHLLIVYWRSAYAELLAGALLPLLLLYALEADEVGSAALVPLSLVICASWLTNAPAAVMANYSLVLFALVLVLLRKRFRAMTISLLAVVIGAALAAFYVFPAAYEQKWVSIWQVLAPGVRPQDNFLFTIISDPVHNRFNLLVSILALFEIAFVSLFTIFSRKQFTEVRNRWWVLAVWGAAASLLMLPITMPAWNYLPKLRFVQLPWRWLLCLNVAFALLLTMAWRKWIARVAVCVVMAGVLIYAGQRVQPPWWDSYDDIKLLVDQVHSGNGYEGTDEYVPLGADPYEIDPAVRKATYQSSGQAFIHVYQWDTQTKLLSAKVTAPGKLILKLFNYPAWHAQVNSTPVTAETKAVTGQMMIPLQPGENVIQITFARTWDRTVGGIVSILAALALCLLAWRQNKLRFRR